MLLRFVAVIIRHPASVADLFPYSSNIIDPIVPNYTRNVTVSDLLVVDSYASYGYRNVKGSKNENVFLVISSM